MEKVPNCKRQIARLWLGRYRVKSFGIEPWKLNFVDFVLDEGTDRIAYGCKRGQSIKCNNPSLFKGSVRSDKLSFVGLPS